MRAFVLVLAISAALLAAVADGWGYNNYCGVAPGAARGIPPLALDGTSSASPRLIQVQTMFRHGDRTPANGNVCWPDMDTAVFSCEANAAQATAIGNTKSTTRTNRLYRFMPIAGAEVYAGDCYAGQLTELGVEQELANGAAFRAAYVGDGKLLADTFEPSEVMFQCDMSARVMTSTMSVIEAMFPHNTAAAETLPLVNIYVQDSETDPTCPNAALCPGLVANAAAFVNSTEFIEYNATVIAPLIQEFEAALNVTGITLTTLQTMFDCANVWTCHNFSLPASVPPALWQALFETATNLTIMQNVFPSPTAYGVLSMGPFLTKFYERALGAINGTEGIAKFYGHGSHDSCVMPFVAAFDLLTQWTPYAGVVIFEFYEMPADSAASHAVRMIVYGEEVLIPGCSAVLCPWPEFEAVLQPLLPTAAQCVGGAASETMPEGVPSFFAKRQ